MTHQLESNWISPSKPKPSPSRLPLDQPAPTVPLVPKTDRSEDPKIHKSTDTHYSRYPEVEELKEEVYEADSSLIDDYVEDDQEIEPTEELKEEDPEPTKKVEKEVIETGSNIVGESEGSQELSTKKAQEQTSNNPPYKVVIESLENKILKTLLELLPPLPNIPHDMDLALLLRNTQHDESLVPEAALSPIKYENLERQVGVPLQKGFSRKFPTRCTMLF